MTREEIRDWAIENGFSPGARPGQFVCPFDSGLVSLDFGARGIRVSLEGHGRTHRIGTFNPGPGMRVNDHGVLEGIGLSASFAACHVSPEPGAETPAWMPEAYLKAIGVRKEAPRIGW